MNSVIKSSYLKTSFDHICTYNDYQYTLGNFKYLEEINGEDSIFGSFNYILKYKDDTLISYNLLEKHKINNYISSGVIGG